ncbi:hypothetical protein [Pseudogemmobacter sonorensis]|uniref:hypothetical protein n=1 Tax=Pseudogemmobacter sonorensis TaxID=2989681 RepID=UPI003692D1BE
MQNQTHAQTRSPRLSTGGTDLIGGLNASSFEVASLRASRIRDADLETDDLRSFLIAATNGFAPQVYRPLPRLIQE